MHLPGAEDWSWPQCEGELSIVRPWPVLLLCTGRNFPQVPLLSPQHPGCIPGKRAGWETCPQPGARAAHGQQGETLARQHPPESSSPVGRRRGLRLGWGGVLIIFGRWVVLLRFKCPAVYQSLPVQHFLLSRDVKSLSAASFPRFCCSSAFPQPLITHFSCYRPMGEKEKTFQMLFFLVGTEIRCKAKTQLSTQPLCCRLLSSS